MTTPCHLGYAYRRGANLQEEPWLTAEEIVSLRERVAARVQVVESGCHLWQGCVRFRSEGYGAIKFRGRVWRVHRLVLAIDLGRWLKSDEVAMHRCNEPACVNPAHLRAGSQGDNVQQCHDEGRHGERIGLDDDDIERVEKLALRGCSSWEISEELFLPRSTVVDYLKRHGFVKSEDQ